MNLEEPILYAGTVEFPFAVGSISIPITILEQEACFREQRHSEDDAESSTPPVSRKRGRKEESADDKKDDAAEAKDGSAIAAELLFKHTHRRVCYIRDGADLSLDSYYRWLYHYRAHHFGEKKEEDDDEIHSPSPFYASIKEVHFQVPSSFPHPHRVLRQPPYFIDDVSWADHAVEITIVFRDVLGVPPLKLSYPVQLQERVKSMQVPQLLSSQHDVPVPIVNPIQTWSSDTSKKKNLTVVEYGELCEKAFELCHVTERNDAVRIYHPTETVYSFFDALRDRRSSSAAVQLLTCYREQLYAPSVKGTLPSHYAHGKTIQESIDCLSEGGGGEGTAAIAPRKMLSVWDIPLECFLPFYHAKEKDVTSELEEILATYPPTAFGEELLLPKTRTQCNLLRVLMNLKKEQEELQSGCRESIKKVVQGIQNMQNKLDDTAKECLKEL